MAVTPGGYDGEGRPGSAPVLAAVQVAVAANTTTAS